MRFVLEHIEELLPIAIFLIVMIYSAVGSKKRPTAPEPERDEDEAGYQYDTEAAPPPQPARTAQGGGGYGEPVDDELRRALDDIFNAKRPQAPTPAPPRHTENEWQETVANRKVKDAKKAAAKAEAKAAQRAADRAPSPTPDALALAMRASEAEAQPSEYASAERARTGVIWSEILQRPVALR